MRNEPDVWHYGYHDPKLKHVEAMKHVNCSMADNYNDDHFFVARKWPMHDARCSFCGVVMAQNEQIYVDLRIILMWVDIWREANARG